MAYSRFSTRFRRRGFKKVAVGPKPKRVYRKKSMAPKVSFARRVNQVIAKNVENKISNTIVSNPYVATWASGTMPTWAHKNFDSMFNMVQGTSMWQRIGNRIKLKRWVMKGLIHPANENDPYSSGATFLRHSYQGTVTVFLLKGVNATYPTANLPQLLQDGNTSKNPTGQLMDQLYSINKDQYKVYWSRKFKVGPSQTGTPVAGGSYTTPVPLVSNNEYKATATFGLDICKYIGKDAIIKYNDNDSGAFLPPSMVGLTMCAIWSPIAGNLGPQAGTPNSYYAINFTSFIEYEDA